MEAWGGSRGSWGDLGAILTPRAAQTLKRQEPVVLWPPLGLLFGALLAHFSAHGRLRLNCCRFLIVFFEARFFIDFRWPGSSEIDAF